MFKQLMYKWFRLEPTPCATCEVLRLQLDESNRERRELLARLLDKEKPESPTSETEPVFKPIQPKFIPWNIRRQMLEQEDRKTAQIKKEKEKEISDLEKELGIPSNEEVKNG